MCLPFQEDAGFGSGKKTKEENNIQGDLRTLLTPKFSDIKTVLRKGGNSTLAVRMELKSDGRCMITSILQSKSGIEVNLENF
jgi:hypothetical protein